MEEALETFARDGFVVLPRALAAEQVADLVDATDLVWEARRGRPDDPLHELGFVRRDERFAELVDHPRVLPLVLRLLGWNVYVYHCHLDVPPRVEPPRWRWHQDGGRQNADLGSPRPLLSVKAGWFVTDVPTPGHGALWVIRGSHVHETLERPENGSVLPPGAEPLLVEAGSAVLLDRRLWHARGDNTSSVVRKVLYYAYTYRWVRPRDVCDGPLWPSEPTDPVRRQLLGGLRRRPLRRALEDVRAVPPYDPGSPCEIKVEFKHTRAADRLRFHAGVERLDGRTIRVEAPTWWEAWRLFVFQT